MKTRWIEVVIIVAALGLLSLCFAAWDNTLPADNQVWNTAAASIRANWDAIEAELGVDLNEAHPYYQAAGPTFKPDGVTAFDADDLGRVWIDSDNGKMYYLSATTPTWTSLVPNLLNDTYLVALDAAGTGTVNLIKANASDVAVLPDGSELATSGAPVADADIANKKYIDDLIVSEVTLSAYTREDSETNDMLNNHAYLAVTDGVVYAYDADLDLLDDIYLYVDTDNDPVGVANIIDVFESGAANVKGSVQGEVLAGEYFEIVSTGSVPVIKWKSRGTLSKPVDQD